MYIKWLRRHRQGDEAVLALIRAIHPAVKGEYGFQFTYKELLAKGMRVGMERVRKLMQQHGIWAWTQRKFVVTSKVFTS